MYNGVISDFGFPVIYLRIYFPAGESRACNTTFIPGNTYVDKREREVGLQFYIVDGPFSEFVVFDRSTAWVFIADDDSKSM